MEEREKDEEKKKKNCRRNIIWYNLPFSKTVATNVAQRFLHLVVNYFPPRSRLNKIFNSNTVKVSFSCMQNMSGVLKAHNNSVLRKKQKDNQQRTENRCNCRDKVDCPMHGNCQIQSIVYKASVTETGQVERNEYLGLTEMTFKKRYDGHMTSMSNERMEKSTELSKLMIWDMKRKNAGNSISWSVVAQTPAYSNASKPCPLCLREKLEILHADRKVNINKRSELVAKCRHENKFDLSNFTPPVTSTRITPDVWRGPCKYMHRITA